jgi:chromosome segregation ATPase
MSDVALAITVTAFVIVTLSGWIAVNYLRRRFRHRQRNMQIVEALDKIRLAADAKRQHGHEAAKVDISGEFRKLATLLAATSREVQEDLNNIEERWRQINVQIKAYENHNATDTLQSSIVSSRTHRLANEIGELAKQLEKKLAQSVQAAGP